MRLKKIELEGYRGISRLEMPLNEDITVLIGRNGVGKTSVLDAMAAILFFVQSVWPSKDQPGNFQNIPIEVKDRKLGENDGFVKAALSFEMGPQQEYRQTIFIKTTISEAISLRSSQSMLDFWQLWQDGILSNQTRTLMVYYRQDRGFERFSRATSGPDIQQVLQSSLQGDLQAISNLQSWWDKRDAEEARNVRDVDPTFRDPQLEAIRKVIKEIDGFDGIKFSSSSLEEGLFLQKSTGDRIHINNLSSGERSFIILLADLARRLQVVCPSKPLGEIPGIVLIDEIELNLHPRWQSKIIPTLLSVFRNCQFIVTTHSPQVVSAIESDHVTIMDFDEDGAVKVQRPLRTKGQTSNYLLEGVFKASERFPEIDKIIDAFNMAVDENDKLKAEALLAEIMLSIEGSPPELLVLRKRLERLQKSL